ncbi:hypothetical protein [Qipengyuania atrilutea]|uniref:Uncharacterized protein n=1 Tax=Qipengyuania atrilutea TaxID=2744473 RepID=A0A850GYV4_9SPHN|nr:hypothetical protein [Actirhodobacter atriluteus]NVD44834.1 hypothetical protein [Actirhodobacter atriluteus]
MTTTLTRFNQHRDGYTKRDEHQIGQGHSGADDINLLVQDFNASKRPAKALSFGIYEDGEMNGATWRKSSAIILDYRIDARHLVEEVAHISAAADRLQVGYWLLDCQERYGQRTLAVIIPLHETVSKDRYARLVYVLLEEMKAHGCRRFTAKGTSAMTHQVHLHAASDCAWVDGPALNATQKIKATKHAAQNFERDRFTIGAQAAAVQLEKPPLTACDDGLFEGL